MKTEKLINKLKKGGITIKQFQKLTKGDEVLGELGWRERMELLKLQGLPLFLEKGLIYLSSAITPIEEAIFVVVDIEVTNSDLQKGELLEIGAVKLKGREVIGEFNSLVQVSLIPEFISKMTGITLSMVQDAQPVREVLEKFRLFLGDGIFLSHPLHFDYPFLNLQFQKAGLGKLLNRSLCTLKFAKKSYQLERYGLSFLKERLGLEGRPIHRGLEDARTTAHLFLKCLEKIPSEIGKVEELIGYVHSTTVSKQVQKQLIEQSNSFGEG